MVQNFKKRFINCIEFGVKSQIIRELHLWKENTEMLRIKLHFLRHNKAKIFAKEAIIPQQLQFYKKNAVFRVTDKALFCKITTFHQNFKTFSSKIIHIPKNNSEYFLKITPFYPIDRFFFPKYFDFILKIRLLFLSVFLLNVWYQPV